jgi:hypothetical protein
MSGWHSLQSVGAFHVLLQVFGVLFAAAVIAAGTTAYHFWNRFDDLIGHAERLRARYVPRWRPDMGMTLHNGFVGVALLGPFVLLAVAYAASAYGHRKTELVAATHNASLTQVRYETETLRRALAEREARLAGIMTLRQSMQTAQARHLAEADGLRQSMREAEVRHLTETAGLRREIEQLQARRASAQADRDAEIRLAAEIDALNRTTEQAAARHAAEVKDLRQRLHQTESRRVASVESLRWELKQAEGRSAAAIEKLERALKQAERKIASFQFKRRLSIEEKFALIDALSPFAGQRVSITAIDGDEDGRGFAADFAEVFEAAGWEHPAVTFRRWDRDPVGVEITLNEQDGRAGRVNVAVGALINITRKLSLTDGNTIYMNGDVPPGQVEIKIGKKLPR